MSGRNSRRRQNYGRRQHDLRERRTRLDFSSFLSLEAPGDAGGGELGTDRLRRPDFELDRPADAL
jgi:hypothetical protein